MRVPFVQLPSSQAPGPLHCFSPFLLTPTPQGPSPRFWAPSSCALYFFSSSQPPAPPSTPPLVPVPVPLLQVPSTCPHPPPRPPVSVPLLPSFQFPFLVHLLLLSLHFPLSPLRCWAQKGTQDPPTPTLPKAWPPILGPAQLGFSVGTVTSLPKPGLSGVCILLQLMASQSQGFLLLGRLTAHLTRLFSEIKVSVLGKDIT